MLAHNDVIARAIADALTVDLIAPQREGGDARAVDLDLRARDAYHRCFSGDRAAPLQLFDELLQITPDDPRALAGRAMAGAAQFLWNEQQRRIALDCATRAVALAPMLADAHYALGMFRMMDGDTVGSVLPIRRALRLAPHHAEAHHCMGWLLYVVSRFDLAQRHLETAMELEPTFEFPYLQLSSIHELRGEHERVDELMDQARARGLGVWLGAESRYLLWRRDARRAAEILATLDRSTPMGQQAAGFLEIAATGRPPPASEPPPLPPGMSPPKLLVWFYQLFEIEVAGFLGDTKAALAALARFAAAEGDDVPTIEHCPLLAELRAMPESEPHRRRIAERAARAAAALDAPDR